MLFISNFWWRSWYICHCDCSFQWYWQLFRHQAKCPIQKYIFLMKMMGLLPTYFQMGKINKVKDKQKKIHIKFENPPDGKCADGAAGNDKQLIFLISFMEWINLLITVLIFLHIYKNHLHSKVCHFNKWRCAAVASKRCESFFN